MTAKSSSLGHEIRFINEIWVWSDNGLEINNKRTCKRCGEYQTKEGYDPCLGYIKGVKSACCGHGLIKGHIMYENE